MRLAILGAGGFIGGHLTGQARQAGWLVTRIARRPLPAVHGVTTRLVGDDAGEAARRDALRGCEVLVCLAARNRPGETPRGSAAAALDAQLAGSRDVPLAWAHSAAAAGVRRFVFVSSVKAVAERSARPLVESDDAHPSDAYGMAKRAAEVALATSDALRALERVIVRPPLVYGPGAGANFGALLGLAASGWPLPLAGAVARRSLISVVNLGDALLACAAAPAASGRVFFVSDGEDLSVAELIGRLRRCAGLPRRLFHAPAALLRGAGALAGRGEQVRRLLDPLQVDSGAIRAALDWRPPQTVDQGLRDAMAWFAGAPGGRGRSA